MNFLFTLSLGVAGFILPNSKHPTKSQIGWFLFILVPFFLYNILCIVEFIVKPYELRRTLFTIFVVNNNFQTLFRPIHLLIYKKQAESLLADFQVLPEGECAKFNAAEREMRIQSEKKILKFSAILYFYNSILCLRTVLPGIIRMVKVMYCQDKRELNLSFCARDSTPLFIVDYYWFTDQFQTPTYYYLFSVNLYMIGVYLIIFCTSDAFTCSTMVALVERSNFLVKMAPTALVPKDGSKTTKSFESWVKYHQHYEKLLRSVNEVMGPVILVTHLFAAGNIMVYVYLIIRDKEQEIRELAASFLFVTAIQFFMYAYWGQQVINNGERLSRATLTANQVSENAYHEGPVRNSLLIIMAKCCGSQTTEITGLGFFTVSLRFYARICSLSMSYLLIMLQL
ncbi:uncharacterized protein LOC132205680 [Neocloeon triangulifer]|uniref:uncharacterized protein LOC132205680 n=1 Tax=Neocloeon triangulifer TaxID=2078957 RepID=UPI00286F7168|nr:uncharacterized protein LOC132205680 [Neocloeon triangulifer]